MRSLEVRGCASGTREGGPESQSPALLRSVLTCVQMAPAAM
jgi:hypothetical protein